MFGIARKALDLAQKVDANQQSHEQVCSQRQGAILERLKQMESTINKAFWALLAGAVAVIYNILHAGGHL